MRCQNVAGGIDKGSCLSACDTSKDLYKCVNNTCVKNETGVAKSVCGAVCGPSRATPRGGEADGGACHLDDGFSYSGANLFGDNKQNTNSTATAGECCALCQHYAGAGCVFYQFGEPDSDAESASCSGHPSVCCRLKTAEAWASRTLRTGAQSGSIKPLPPPPPPPPPDLNGSVVVFSAGLGGVPNYRIPAIVQTTGSPPALVAFAEARNGSDPTASRIAVRTSTDAGETWSAVTFAAGMCSPQGIIQGGFGWI